MADLLPNGAAVILALEDPAMPGTFITLGCQRDGSWDENQATIDVSCKDSRNMRVRPGRYSGSISVELVYDPADPAYVIARDSVRTGTLVRFLRTEDGVATEETDAVITAMSYTAPDQDTATVSLSADIDDQWVAA